MKMILLEGGGGTSSAGALRRDFVPGARVSNHFPRSADAERQGYEMLLLTANGQRLPS